MSIKEKWHTLDSQKRFLLSYPFFFLLLFGLFYWGEYWQGFEFAKAIDIFHRDTIMQILSLVVDEPIKGYKVLFDNHTRLVITPECNGLVPFLMLAAAILAYPSSIKLKLKWLLIAYISFMVANIVRLIGVYFAIKSFGVESFYIAHDIIGNLFLIALGAFIFFQYLGNIYANKTY